MNIKSKLADCEVGDFAERHGCFLNGDESPPPQGTRADWWILEQNHGGLTHSPKKATFERKDLNEKITDESGREYIRVRKGWVRIS